MHESQLAEQIIEEAIRSVRYQGGSRILEIWIELGELAGDPQALESAFLSMIEAHPMLGNCKLKLELIPARAECKSCNRWIDPRIHGHEFIPICPECGGELKLISGDECYLKQISFI